MLLTSLEMVELTKRVAEETMKFRADSKILEKIVGLQESGLSWREVMIEVGLDADMARVWIESQQRTLRNTREIVACVLESAVENLDEAVKAEREMNCNIADEEIVGAFRAALIRLKDDWERVNVG